MTTDQATLALALLLTATFVLFAALQTANRPLQPRTCTSCRHCERLYQPGGWKWSRYVCDVCHDNSRRL